MFFNGRVYNVKRPKAALHAAGLAYLDKLASVGEDSLDGYDLREEAARSVKFTAWLVKHLVPDFKEEITERNVAAISRWLEIWLEDPQRATILTTRDYRRWEAKQNEPA